MEVRLHVLAEDDDAGELARDRRRRGHRRGGGRRRRDGLPGGAALRRSTPTRRSASSPWAASTTWRAASGSRPRWTMRSTSSAPAGRPDGRGRVAGDDGPSVLRGGRCRASTPSASWRSRLPSAVAGGVPSARCWRGMRLRKTPMRITLDARPTGPGARPSRQQRPVPWRRFRSLDRCRSDHGLFDVAVFAGHEPAGGDPATSWRSRDASRGGAAHQAVPRSRA